jgi:hypothetical protein
MFIRVAALSPQHNTDPEIVLKSIGRAGTVAANT